MGIKAKRCLDKSDMIEFILLDENPYWGLNLCNLLAVGIYFWEQGKFAKGNFVSVTWCGEKSVQANQPKFPKEQDNRISNEKSPTVLRDEPILERFPLFYSLPTQT